MQSQNNTLIGAGPSIIDADGNVWTITDNGQVAVNGHADPTTANVTHLAYSNGLVWQENTQDLWWSKDSPLAPWAPPFGTPVVPLPVESASHNNTVIGLSVPSGPPAVITDTSDNTWTINNGQVVVNGVVDPTTAHVIELAYIGGKIWQENSQNLWWSKGAPADPWAPVFGTQVNPVVGDFWIGNTPGDHATINVGALTTSIEDGSGTPPQSLGQIITPGVLAHGTTIEVSTETATLVVNGDSKLTSGAMLRLIGAYRTPTEIDGPLQNNGTMVIRDSTLRAGALSGNGTIKATAGSTVVLQSASQGETIQLRSSHLSIGGQGNEPGGMTFLAPVTMNRASTITLNDTTATTEELVRATSGAIAEVRLFNGTTEVADLKVGGVAHLYASQTGSGTGAMVTLSTTHTSSDLPIVHVTS